mgnify:CR=1 FL=1
MALGVKLEDAPALKVGGQPASQVLPPLAVLNRMGALFCIDMHAGTAKIPVVAMPVASPEWGLFNADPVKRLYLMQASCTQKSSTSMGLGLAIVAASAIGRQTAVTTDYGGTIKSALNGSQAKPNVWLADNPTLVGGTPAWHVFDATKPNTIATNSIGDGLVAKVDGLLSAPPNGGMIGFEIVGEIGVDSAFTVSFIIAML